MEVVKNKTIPKKIIQNKGVQKSNSTKNASSIFDKIQDQKLRETLILIKNSTNIKLNYNNNLKDPKEIEDYFREEIETYLNERYNEIHEKVSELREKGHDMMVWTFKLMAIPLKIKVFVSTGDKKDFNLVTAKINEISKAVNEILEKIKQREQIYKQRKILERQQLEASKKKVVSKKTISKKVVKNNIVKKPIIKKK
jgi:hypothetical protein